MGDVTVTEGMIVCTICRHAKVIGEFQQHKSSPDGRRKQCRSCCNAQSKKWRQAHPERVRANNAKRPKPPPKRPIRETEEGRLCSHCKLRKPREAFSKAKAGPGGLDWTCRTCLSELARAAIARDPIVRRARIVEYAKQRRKRDPDKVRIETRKSWMKTKYGLTLDRFDEMLKEQDHKCAICSREVVVTGKGYGHGVACVDHDHATGSVRAILCGACNRAIGLLKDSPAFALRAHEYLLKWKDVP